ncbi:MAG: heparan-alpha-glucosaminide N-acetyltransferase domain-containing protein [Saccharofermentanales bacterium]
MKNRVFELDFLRGLAIIMMILHHLIYDLRYIMELDIFAWQESYVFEYWIRAPFVFIFLIVSGISCTFSRSNWKRSMKMAAVAIAFSIVFYIVSIVSETQMYVFFNIIHVLAVGTILYSFLDYLEKKKIIRDITLPLLAMVILFMWLEYPLSKIQAVFLPVLLPLHEQFASGVGMADYMPLVPWIGLFFAGAIIGRLFYSQHKTLLPDAPEAVRSISAPFEFVGRNSLLFYIFHQPVLLLVLFLLRTAGIL